MQTLTEKLFHLAPPDGIFDDAVITAVFPNHSEGARRALLHRAVHSAEVLRLKPGLYCLAKAFRQAAPHPFCLASQLLYPSQISLESALAHHGLIPEAVYQITSVTSCRSRSFSTPLGRFAFVRVPCHALRAGVSLQEVQRERWAFISSPLRALADLVYVRKEISWERDGLAFLTESLRIEEDDLDTLSFADFDAVFASLRNKRTLTYLEGLHRELRR